MISEINKSINEYLLEESELSRIKLLMSRRISYLMGKKGCLERNSPKRQV